MPRQKNVPVRVLKTALPASASETSALVPSRQNHLSTSLLMTSPFRSSYSQDARSVFAQQNHPPRVYPTVAPDMQTLFSQLNNQSDARRLLNTTPCFPFVASDNVKSANKVLVQSTSVNQEKNGVKTQENSALQLPNVPNTRATLVAPHQRHLPDTFANAHKQIQTGASKPRSSYAATVSTQSSHGSNAGLQTSHQPCGVSNAKITRDKRSSKKHAYMNIQERYNKPIQPTNSFDSRDAFHSYQVGTQVDHSFNSVNTLELPESRMRSNNLFACTDEQTSHQIVHRDDPYTPLSVQISQTPSNRPNYILAPANAQNAHQILPQFLTQTPNFLGKGQISQGMLPTQFCNGFGSTGNSQVHHLPIGAQFATGQANHISHIPEMITMPYHNGHDHNTLQPRLPPFNHSREISDISSVPYMQMARTSSVQDKLNTVGHTNNTVEVPRLPYTSFPHVPAAVRKTNQALALPIHAPASVNFWGGMYGVPQPHSQIPQLVNNGGCRDQFSLTSGGFVKEAQVSNPVNNNMQSPSHVSHVSSSRKTQGAHDKLRTDFNNVHGTSGCKSKVLYKPPAPDISIFPSNCSETSTDLGNIPGLYTSEPKVCNVLPKQSSHACGLRNGYREVPTTKIKDVPVPDSSSVKVRQLPLPLAVPVSSTSSQIVTLNSSISIQKTNQVPATGMGPPKSTTSKVIEMSTAKSVTIARTSKAVVGSKAVPSNIIRYASAQGRSHEQNTEMSIKADSFTCLSQNAPRATHTVIQNKVQSAQVGKDYKIPIAFPASTHFQNVAPSTHMNASAPPVELANKVPSEAIGNCDYPPSSILNKMLSSQLDHHPSSSSGHNTVPASTNHTSHSSSLMSSSKNVPSSSISNTGLSQNEYGSSTTCTEKTINKASTSQTKNLHSSTTSVLHVRQKLDLQSDKLYSVYPQGGGSVRTDPQVQAAYRPTVVQTGCSVSNKLQALAGQKPTPVQTGGFTNELQAQAAYRPTTIQTGCSVTNKLQARAGHRPTLVQTGGSITNEPQVRAAYRPTAVQTGCSVITELPDLAGHKPMPVQTDGSITNVPQARAVYRPTAVQTGCSVINKLPALAGHKPTTIQTDGSITNEPHAQPGCTPVQADENSQSSPKQAHPHPGFPVFEEQPSSASGNSQMVVQARTAYRPSAEQTGCSVTYQLQVQTDHKPASVQTDGSITNEQQARAHHKPASVQTDGSIMIEPQTRVAYRPTAVQASCYVVLNKLPALAGHKHTTVQTDISITDKPKDQAGHKPTTIQTDGSITNEPQTRAGSTPIQANENSQSSQPSGTSDNGPMVARRIMTRSRSRALGCEHQLQDSESAAPPPPKRKKCKSCSDFGVRLMTRRRWAANTKDEQLEFQEVVSTMVEVEQVHSSQEPAAVCVQQAVVQQGEESSAIQLTQVVKSQQDVDMSGSLKMRISLTEQRIVSVGCAPNLKGRPRRKRKKRSLSPGGSESNESESSLSTVSSSVKGKQLQLQSSQQQEPQPSCSKRVTLAPPRRNNSLVQSRKSTRIAVGTQDEKDFLTNLHTFMNARGTPIQRVPHLGFKEIDLYVFYMKVQKLGGYNAVTANRFWKTIYDELGGYQGSTSAATYTRRHYERLLLPFDRHLRGEKPVSRSHMKLKEGKKQGAVKLSNQASTSKLNNVASKPNSLVPATKSSTVTSSSAKSSTPLSSTKQSADIKSADDKVKSKGLEHKQLDTSQDVSSTSLITPGKENIPVSNATEDTVESQPEPCGESVSKDETSPEVIDLAGDSPVKIGKTTVPAVKKRKLDILKEGGLEVTAISSLPAVAERRPSVIQHAAPIQPSDSQVSITVTPDVSHIIGSPATDPASTPSPSLSYDSQSQQQTVTNGHDYNNKTIAIYTSPDSRLRPTSRSGGWTPPRVPQPGSMYARSESTVYGNPKESIDTPRLQIQPPGLSRPSALIRDEVLDLRVKCAQKPVVTLSRVTNNLAHQGPSRNSPRTLPKPSSSNSSFPSVGGRTVIGTLGSNLEITVVDVPKTAANSSHRNHQIPQSQQPHHMKASQVHHKSPSPLSNKYSSRSSSKIENGKYNYSSNSQTPHHRNNTLATNGSNPQLVMPSPYHGLSSNSRSGSRLPQLPSTSMPNNVVPPYMPGGGSSLYSGYLPPTASGNGAKPPYMPLYDPGYFGPLYNSPVYSPTLPVPGYVSQHMYSPTAEQIQIYKTLMNQHHNNMRFPQQNSSFSYLGLPRDGSTSITPVNHSTNPTSK